MALNKAFKYLGITSRTERSFNNLIQNNDSKIKPYSVQREYTVQYIQNQKWQTMSKNKHVENYGLDGTLPQVLERTLSGTTRFVGYMS